MLGGVRSGGCSGAKIQLRQYARDVPVDGVFAQSEPVGDVLVAHPLCHQAEDLCLASAQARILANLFMGLFGLYFTQ